MATATLTTNPSFEQCLQSAKTQTLPVNKCTTTYKKEHKHYLKVIELGNKKLTIRR